MDINLLKPGCKVLVGNSWKDDEYIVTINHVNFETNMVSGDWLLIHEERIFENYKIQLGFFGGENVRLLSLSDTLPKTLQDFF